MRRPVALLTEPSTSRYDEARPSLAVVGDEGGYRRVLDRSIALATGAGAPLQVVVLHHRVRLTTDPALLGYVTHRLQQRLQTLQAELGPWDLAELAWTQNTDNGRVLVAVPDEADSPMPAGS